MSDQTPFKPALIVVDMQNDFCPPNGSLAVAGARETLPLINSLLASPRFVIKVATQDWHPPNHISFASNHAAPDNVPFDTFIEVKNHVANLSEETMRQRLWPVHCVQSTQGSELVEGLDTSKVDIFVKKGSDARVEMYSAFSDSFGNLTAGQGGVSHDLAQSLKEAKVSDVYVVGVAGDYCVKYTAIDARKSGFNVLVIDEAVRCVDASSWDDVKKEFHEHGVRIVSMTEVVVQKFIVASTVQPLV